MKLGNEYSPMVNVTSGVPQGTILSTILFLIYINDIADNLRCKCRLYADDCVLYDEVNSIDDAKLLQEDLSKVTEWAKIWKLKFNVDKCRVMNVSKKKRKFNFRYHIDNKVLECSQNEKYLGVTITDSLSWSTHIHNVKRDCYSKIGIINRVFGKCPTHVKTKLYQQLVLPKIDYCSSVWSPGSVGLIKQLDKIQYKATKVILGDKSDTYVNNMKALKFQSVHVRHIINRMVMVHKIVNNMIGIVFSKYFSIRNINRQLRNTNDKQLEYKFASTNVCQMSFFYKSVNEWNNLPNHIVNTQSLNMFKTKLFQHFQQCSQNCLICQCM